MLLARMLEDEVDVVALAGDVPDRLAEFAAFFHVVGIAGGVVDVGQLAPAIELAAVDHALGAELHDEIALGLVGDHADGVGAGGRDQLHRHGAEAAGRAPHQHIMAGAQDMRAVAEQHAVGGGERQRVAGALFPGQVLRAAHELAVLHPAELGEGAVGRLVAPDALRRAEHGIAAVALLVVAVVLVAVDHDLVADLPALHLGADGPDHARGVGAGDVILRLVHVEGRDRACRGRPRRRCS